MRRGRSGIMCERQGGEEGGGQQVEPKWATVSSYCKRHGVNRGPVQCRKRWSNLAGDYKKIKEWESQIKDDSDSFWLMRNDLRRDKKLPGFFDREVFDILNTNINTNTNTNNNDNNNNNKNNCSSSSGGTIPIQAIPMIHDLDVKFDPDAEEAEPLLFDSGRSATADDGLFSDFEPQHNQHHEDDAHVKVQGQTQAQDGDEPSFASPNPTTPIPAPIPVSEKQYQPVEATPPGNNYEKQRDGLNLEIGSTSHEGRKRRRLMEDDDHGEGVPLENQLIQVLERNGRMLSAQLDSYNMNMKLDREERKDHSTSLVAVLNKLADSLGRIADKL